MAKIIAICNQKGGVGKSTTAVNVGAYLALSGKRVLLIDLDAQGNATTACGIDRKQLHKDIYAVIIGDLLLAEAVRKTGIERLDLVPASLDLAGAEPYLMNLPERETTLKRLLEPILLSYDVVLFDCPPALGMITLNALVAANSTMIPVQCEYLALEGLNSLLQTINLIKQKLNPSLRVGGIVLTMTDFRVNLAKEVADEVKRYFKDMVFDTSIPRNVRLAESPSFGKPIHLYDPHSTGAMAYQLLTQEVITKEFEAANDQALR
jgi:chromosome partitioning protein